MQRDDGADVPSANLDVLDLTHDAIFKSNMGGVIEYWNRTAERIYGWKAQEAIGRVSHRLLKTKYPVPFDCIEAQLLHTGCWEGELIQARKDGTRLIVASRWTLQRDACSIPVAIVETNSDITGHRHAEAEQARLAERLRRAEKLEAIGCFASGIAHDFSNVLSGIVAYGEMLFDEALEGTPPRRYAQNVLTAATRGRELVEQILEYTRCQHGKRGPIDVCRGVADTLELVRGLLPPCITLNATIPDEPLIVIGDAIQLYQVVTNLCNNAVQAMEAGGSLRVAVAPIEIGSECSLSHGMLKAGSYVLVSVEDGGCGMHEATLGRIFEPFFTTKAPGRGTGLGLALAYTIVTNFGGVIDVKSAPGEGSSFSIYLPVADPRNAV